MAKSKEEYTPMMVQYFEIKEKYPDSILMYRLGDFYEMFFDDAKIASKILDIALTGRNCGTDERAPMCGIPFHAADSYISKLVAAGYSVAICEQTEDPAKARGIVKRDVIRVITPGTIMDQSALDAGSNNYLASLCIHDNTAGFAYADITTGEFSAYEFAGDIKTQILNEVVRIAPRELIMSLEAFEDTALYNQITSKVSCFARNYYDWAYEHDSAGDRLVNQFGESLAELGLADKPQAVCAAGALLFYFADTQKTQPQNITKIEAEEDDSRMQIDMYSIRNLELTETLRSRGKRGSLLDVIDKTQTPMGARALRRLITAPYKNCAVINNRLLSVEELLKNPMLRAELTEALRGVKDIERTISKITYKTANCQDLIALKNSFMNLPLIKKCVLGCSAKTTAAYAAELDTLDDLTSLISRTINDDAPAIVRSGGLIREGASEEIDKLKSIKENSSEWLRDLVEEEKEKTGIKTMKLGYNKVFGYYVEVSNSYKGDVPDYFIRRQTLTNGERYITPRMKEIEETVLSADSNLADMEYELFCEVRDRVAGEFERISKTAAAVAGIDLICSFANLAEKNKYVMPTVDLSDKISIKDGRHPVVEKLNSSSLFIPNDINLDRGENQVAIITGPNMAGKSTYMRQCAIITLMAQMGCFVPAKQARIGIVDKIFTRVGASDDLSAGQSTFMVEMTEVAYILDNATNDSLIILDEIGRGTSTYDGLSIAWAVVEYIADIKKCGARTMFATHYHELTELEEKIANVKNYSIAARKSGTDITFLRKIIRGGADESFGVEVAALAGVKRSVIRRAKEIAGVLEAREHGEVSEAKVRTAAKKQSEVQLGFFAGEENEIICELKSIQLDTMTPVEALTKLYDLNAKAKQL